MFSTKKVKVTSPPVSGTDVGEAVLVTLISGATSLKSTVASSVSVTSLAVAVTVFIWFVPAFPVRLFLVNLHS